MLPSRAIENRVKNRLSGYALRSNVPNESLLKSGTTSLALKFKDGVVLAADMKASKGSVNYEFGLQKIFIMSKFSALAYAGLVGILQLIQDIFREEIEIFEYESGITLPIKNQEVVLKKIIRKVYLSDITNDFAFILGGYDLEDKEPKIYEFDAAAGSVEKQYAVIGSGTNFALSYLDTSYQAKLSKKAALELAIEAVKAGAYRDQHTGDKVLAVIISSKEMEIRHGH